MSNDGWTWTVDTTLPSRRGAHVDLMQDVLARLSQLGWDGRDLFGIEMTLEETLSNAIRHGNQLNESKSVFVDCKISPQRFWMRVRDEGEGFNPDAVPDCTAEENIEACGGRGVMLVRAYMTSVEFNKQGNCVTLEKLRSQESDNNPDEQ